MAIGNVFGEAAGPSLRGERGGVLARRAARVHGRRRRQGEVVECAERLLLCDVQRAHGAGERRRVQSQRTRGVLVRQGRHVARV